MVSYPLELLSNGFQTQSQRIATVQILISFLSQLLLFPMNLIIYLINFY